MATETMYYPVKGAIGPKDANGDIIARQSIHDLFKNKEQFELYLLGLRKWYDQDPDKLLSYFQIAGIHGMPFKQWNGEETQKIGNQETIGYCTHTTVLFPSWHRPYVAMYEQRLQEVMLEEIVAKIPDAAAKAKYQKAAEQFRVPYWDWALPGPDTGDKAKIHQWLPPTSWEPQVVITIPGHQGVIDNPLYKFEIPNKKSMGEYGVGTITSDDGDSIMYGNAVGLSRCPQYKYYYRDNYDGATGEEDKKKYEEQIKGQNVELKDTASWPQSWRDGTIINEQIYANFKDMPWAVWAGPGNDGEEWKQFNKQHRAGENVYRMMHYSTDYRRFATNGGLDEKEANGIPQGQWYQSLEGIHNTVHWWVGGANNGHMSQVPVASFDPFFWMHHTNIERYYCTWQWLHRNDPEETQWFDDKTEEVANTSGQIVDVDGNVVTDKTKQKVDTLVRGPNTKLAPFRKDRDNYYTSNDVRDHTIFNYTYPDLQRKGRTDKKMEEDIWEQINQNYSPWRQHVLDRPGSNGDLEIVVNVTYNKFLLHGRPFVINLYLCKGGKKDPTQEQIGDIYNFSQPGHDAGKPVCSNCIIQQQSDIKCRAQFSISHLKPYFKTILPSLDTDNEGDLEKFLKERLYVMVFATSGRPLGFQNEQSPVTLSVATSRVEYSTNDCCPTGFQPLQAMTALAGNVAEMMLVPPGALILSVTGNVLGVLDQSGKVLDSSGKVVSESLTRLTGISNNGFKDVLDFSSGALGAATDLTGAFMSLGGGGSKKGDKKGDGKGGLGGLW